MKASRRSSTLTADSREYLAVEYLLADRWTPVAIAFVGGHAVGDPLVNDAETRSAPTSLSRSASSRRFIMRSCSTERLVLIVQLRAAALRGMSPPFLR